MHAPDAVNDYLRNPEYIRKLIRSIPLSQRAIARRLGLSDRYVRQLVAGDRECSYVIQFALEALLDTTTRSEAIPTAHPESSRCHHRTAPETDGLAG